MPCLENKRLEVSGFSGLKFGFGVDSCSGLEKSSIIFLSDYFPEGVEPQRKLIEV